jgi:OFA family oxalate/formate antiporter-like MFS transporter
MFGTALVFHILSIFTEAGRSELEAVTYFFPAACVSVSTNLLGSWLSDYWPLKNLLIIKLIGFVLGAWGILHLQHDWGYWLLVAGFGTTSGLWGVLSNLAFIRFFGRRFLGEISGMNMTLTVIGSAIGPVMFSLGLDLSGSYHAAIWINLILVLVLLLAAIFVKQNEPGKLQKSFYN